MDNHIIEKSKNREILWDNINTVKANYPANISDYDYSALLSILGNIFIHDARNRKVNNSVLLSYEVKLNNFFEYLIFRKINIFFFTDNNLDDFIEFHLKKRKSKHTINGYLKMVLFFFRWLVIKEFIDKNPIKSLPILIPEPPQNSTLNPEDISKLLSVCSSNNFYDVRNRAIILLLWDTAIGRNECLNAKLKDVNMENKFIKISKSKNQEFTAFLSDKTIKSLKEWIDIRGLIPTPYLFVNWVGKQIHPTNLSSLLKEIGNKANLKVSPRIIKNSVLKYMRSRGLKSMYFQMLLMNEKSTTECILSDYSNSLINNKKQLFPANFLK